MCKCAFRILVFLILLAGVSLVAAADDSWNILIIHSYHRGYPWTSKEEAGIRAVFEKTPKARFYVEFLDTKRVSLTPRYRKMLVGLFKFKYSSQRIDVVIVTDNNALTFAVSNHEELFPGVPIVFCGVNNFRRSMLHDDRLVTGVVEDPSEKDTLSLALRIHPDAEEFFVVLDNNTTTSLEDKKRFVDAVQRLGVRDRARFIIAEHIDPVLKRLSHIPRNSFVMTGHLFLKDSSGSILPMSTAIERVSESSPVPVYGFCDFVLGYGIVGGKLVSGFEQGRAAGEMALKILQGASPWEIPVLTRSPNRYMFDYRQLKRFGISLSSLPENSLVINRPESFYTRHKSLVQAAFIIFAFLVLAVVILSVNIMKRLRAEERLRESEAMFRALVEQALVGVYMLAPDGSYTYLNKAVAKTLGCQEEELKGLGIEDVIYPPDLPLVRGKVKDLFDGKVDRGRVVCRIVTKDGKIRWSESFGRRILYKGFPAILGTATDITERIGLQQRLERYSQELEEKVRQRTEELQQKISELERLTGKLETTNAELEAFTFSVSHDLRAPLRTMEGFANALQEDFGEHLPAEAKGYLERIVASARRMDELIENLLKYSRISKQEISLIEVDMDEIIEDVVEQLEGEIERVGAEVDIVRPLGRVWGNRTVLQHVVFNLLANALKFVDRDRQPKVRVYSESRGNRVRFWFEDNGIGIPKRHLHKIFFLFERLHGIESYPGTGVGLAIVKRGVERMDGEVGVESTPGEGSRFWFELKAA